MAISQELYEKLTAAVSEKAPVIQPCPVCGQAENFMLLNSFVNLPFHDDTKTFGLGAQFATHLVLVCRKCGNSNLLNVNILGVSSLIEEHLKKG